MQNNNKNSSKIIEMESHINVIENNLVNTLKTVEIQKFSTTKKEDSINTTETKESQDPKINTINIPKTIEIGQIILSTKEKQNK